MGTTQNPKECINSMVEVQCAKHEHHGFKVVQYAVASVTCHYHSEAPSRLKIMDRLAILGGICTRQAANTKDDGKQLRKSDMQTTQKERKCRQGEQLLWTCREEALSGARHSDI